MLGKSIGNVHIQWHVHIVFDFSDKHAASDCVIQENSSQKLNVMAKFEQPQLSSGCIVPQTDISR